MTERNLETFVISRELKNLEIVEEFADSDLDCAKVEGWTQKTALSCAASLNKSIKTFKKGNIRAISRGGEVFLIKTK